jgi:endoglucanase Acf2
MLLWFGASFLVGAQLPEHFDQTSRPVATHRFWAAKNWFPVGTTPGGGQYVMFPEPLAVQPTPEGLKVGYGARIDVGPSFFVHPAQMDLTIGAERLNAVSIPIVARTDRTVDLSFGPIKTRIGRGLPFVYIETDGTDPTVTFANPPKVFNSNRNMLGVTVGPNSYGLFCPGEVRWQTAASVFTCHLTAGHRCMSIALLPRASELNEFARYAFSFPVDDEVHWRYDEQGSGVETTFRLQTRAMEGTETGILQVLYPHQYAKLKDSGGLSESTYLSARGVLKLYKGSAFTTVNSFHGFLPFLPLASKGIESRTELVSLLARVVQETVSFPSQDTYGAGKRLNRLAQLLPIAAMTGDDSALAALKERLRTEFDSWSMVDGGSGGTRIFRYNKSWGTLVGYPGSFGSDTQVNDHHFHYGYWIHAAALLGLYDPRWLNSDHTSKLMRGLVLDIANIDPHDRSYPFLRHFDAYAGHSWASGQAPFADGGNQESTSEAVNAWAGIALYAAEIGNRALRDAAIWMYTLETDSAFDYWFNAGPVQTFPTDFRKVQISNLFDGKSDAATWFGSEPAFGHGIQFLPFTGASLYLGRDPEYCRRNLQEVTIASPAADPRKGPWPDLMELYQAFYAPKQALEFWKATEFTFDGESRAHENAWLESMLALGQSDVSVTADTPYYAVFGSAEVRKHVAFNPGEKELTVHFSDGVALRVPERALVSDSKAVVGWR